MTRATSERHAIEASIALEPLTAEAAPPRVVVVEGIGQVARCGCVLAESGEYEPCADHAMTLVLGELDTVVSTSVRDVAGEGVPADHWGRSRFRWHVTDSRMVATVPGTAPVKSSRTVVLPVGDVLADDERWHASHRCIEDVQTVSGWQRRECRDITTYTYRADEYAADIAIARETHAAERAAKMQASANKPDKPTTRAARKAGTGGRRRTAAEIATAKVAAPVAADLERMARLTAALAVGGDTWADRS